MNDELDEREVIGEIWSAYQREQVVTALVNAQNVGDAIVAMRWASTLAGLRYGVEICGFDRADVSIYEPPFPEHLSHLGDDTSTRVLMFRPRPPLLSPYQDSAAQQLDA